MALAQSVTRRGTWLKNDMHKSRSALDRDLLWVSLVSPELMEGEGECGRHRGGKVLVGKLMRWDRHQWHM